MGFGRFKSTFDWRGKKHCKEWDTQWKCYILNPKSWRFGSDDAFQLGDLCWFHNDFMGVRRPMNQLTQGFSAEARTAGVSSDSAISASSQEHRKSVIRHTGPSPALSKAGNLYRIIIIISYYKSMSYISYILHYNSYHIIFIHIPYNL